MTAASQLDKVKRFHDMDASSYRTDRYHSDSCEGLAYVTRKALILDWADTTTGSILDIGCGPSILTQDLLDRNLRVYGTDLSLEMIKEGKRHFTASSNGQKPSFSVSDASHLCFQDGQIDTVLCIGLLCYVSDYNLVLSEIHRTLKPGGIAIIQINKILYPSVYRALVPFYHRLKSKLTSKKYDNFDFQFNYFTYRKFLGDLKAKGFRIEELSNYDYRIPFLDILLPVFSLKLGHWMFQNRRIRLLGALANGLLIKVSKPLMTR